MRTELPLHDASFSGIVLRHGGADLFFAQADGTPRVVRLTGVDAMQMDDFRPGNITVLFETVSAELPREAVDWDRLYPAPHPAAAQVYQDRYAEFLARKHSAIAQGRLTFVRMVPAYGADLLAVCERVEFADG
ncbi:MAG TPA: hypothetical protein VEZ20_15005 [Allosphingosinicella sp.]|jgi:hypothetical protein|nr:hypothetical protein [Allosphingosinicella sp.]